MRLALMILSMFAALTACGDKAADSGPERKSAAGEILGGEISDAMLPLDTVRSTSPVGSDQPEADARSAPSGRARPPAPENTATEGSTPEPTAAPPSASPNPQGTQGT